MKVLHINTYDTGGAATACLRLHQGLLQMGVDSKVLLKHKTRSIHNTFQFEPLPPTFFQKLYNKFVRIGKELKIIPLYSKREKKELVLHRLRKGLEMFSYPLSDVDITQSPLYQEADIIHLHWVANFLDWKTFFAKNTKPVVWTLHDQNPFLGIEHYAERFIGMNEQGLPVPRKYTELEIHERDYWLA
ncbi:MAG: hypothetical protein NZ516_10495, partial [Raineya sp.]|nr:hypothetical protein [Raineya sp.]